MCCQQPARPAPMSKNCANSPVHILRLWMKTYEYLWKYDILGMNPHKSQLFCSRRTRLLTLYFFWFNLQPWHVGLLGIEFIYSIPPPKKCRKVEDLEHMWASPHLYQVSHFSASFFGGMKCKVSVRASLKKRSSSRNSSSLRGAGNVAIDNPI